ncbi:cytochrome p450 [Rhyzopertha dominica]|nr:cytochrome p450 [Rhyzopertha dominica]
MGTTFGVYLLLFIPVAIVWYKVRKWLKVWYALSKIPGPYCYPLVGNIPQIKGGTEQLYQSFREFSSRFKIYRLWMCYVGSVNLTLAEDIEAVISSTNNIKKGRAYEPLWGWLRFGLLTSDGGKWHTRRKILTPTFHFAILQQFTNIFVQQSQILTQELEAASKNKHFIDVVPIIVTYTLNSICDTAMGIKLNMKNKKQLEYKRTIEEFGAILVHRISRPLLYESFTLFFSPTYWRERKTANALHEFSSNVIEERKRTFDGSITTKVDDENFGKKKLAMLDLLLSAKAEGLGFCFRVTILRLFASVSRSCSWLITKTYRQDKVYDEIIEVLGTSDCLPTYQQLQQLQYLEMCLKESLRLYPSVPFISRTTSTEVMTPSGYLIPAGVDVHIHIYDLHRNPEVFKDPERFDPDRFLPENTAGRHPFAYLPFSGGPRNCIGQKFALLELKAAISSVIRKFVLEAVDTPTTITYIQELMLRSKNGIKIGFKIRDTIKDTNTQIT